MTGKTTNLILLGAISGLILGGLFGYLWPSTLTADALYGVVISFLIIAMVAMIATMRTGKSLTAATFLSISYLFTVTFVTFLAGTLISGFISGSRDSAVALTGAPLFLLVAVTLVYGGIATSLGAFTLAEMLTGGTDRRPSQGDNRFRRPDRGRFEHAAAGGGRSDRRDFRSDDARGRDNRQQRERQQGDRDRDRGGQRRERPQFERKNEPGQRSPFAVTASPSPTYDAEMSEAKPETRAQDREPRGEQRPEGQRHDGHRRGERRDRGPRQNRDRRGPSRGDHRTRFAAADRGNTEPEPPAIKETVDPSRQMELPVPGTADRTESGGMNSESPFSVNRSEASNGASSQDHVEQGPEAMTYGRSRFHHRDEHSQPETPSPELNSETVSQVADSYSNDGISFGRSRRRRPR